MDESEEYTNERGSISITELSYHMQKMGLFCSFGEDNEGQLIVYTGLYANQQT